MRFKLKSKNQLISLNVIITIVSIYFTFAVYKEYKASQKIKVENYINKTINQNEKVIKNVFLEIKHEIEKDRILFFQIHQKYTNQLRINPTLDIYELKKDITSNYDLENKEVHLFLLDETFTVTHSTYPPDIGFKLAQIPDARIELDRAEDGGIHQSQSVSIDLINSEIKSYSYSKINDNLYFEMGFINKKIHTILKSTIEKVQLLTNKKSNLFRIEQKIDGTQYYDDIFDKDIKKNKEEYISSKEMFPKDKETDNLIILSNRTGQVYKKYLDDELIVYIPLIKKNNKYLELMGDFVLELHIDRKDEIELNKKIDNYFFIFLIFHIFFLLIIYFFTKKYYETQAELNKKVEENEQLLENNRDFISGMTKQIETPLSVIMNNYSFIKGKITTPLLKYDEQINSSINMLENSYEDLTYIVNNEKVEYLSENINLSSFLKERIEFFDVIAKSKGSFITSDITDNIYIFMNQIELERVIDNNLSNAIKYGETSKGIFITLSKTNKGIILSFHSSSEEIKNKEKIFYKNYQEKLNSKKSLGLGLSMVKSICEKYNITYKVEYKNGKNIFIFNLLKVKV